MRCYDAALCRRPKPITPRHPNSPRRDHGNSYPPGRRLGLYKGGTSLVVITIACPTYPLMQPASPTNPIILCAFLAPLRLCGKVGLGKAGTLTTFDPQPEVSLLLPLRALA